MSRPDLPGMLTSSRIAAGVRLRATSSNAAPSAKQITSYPPVDRITKSVSRMAGSSSTTKISPREPSLSVMCHRPELKHDTHLSHCAWRGIGLTVFVRDKDLTYK